MADYISIYQSIVDAVVNSAKNLLGPDTTEALIENALEESRLDPSLFKIKEASLILSSSNVDELGDNLNSFLESFSNSLSEAINPLIVSNLLSNKIKDTVEKQDIEEKIKKLGLDKKLLVLDGIIKK